jgi:hypothetical protein
VAWIWWGCNLQHVPPPSPEDHKRFVTQQQASEHVQNLGLALSHKAATVQGYLPQELERDLEQLLTTSIQLGYPRDSSGVVATKHFEDSITRSVLDRVEKSSSYRFHRRSPEHQAILAALGRV